MRDGSHTPVEQLRILRHMLGIDDPYMAKPTPYRNYYCANPGDAKMHELVRLGLVVLYSTHGSYEWFACTTAGRDAAVASQKAMRVSKSKRLYAKFLDISDCWPDLTFKRFLTDPQFHETRRAA
jgi:hypothetical protein